MIKNYPMLDGTRYGNRYSGRTAYIDGGGRSYRPRTKKPTTKYPSRRGDYNRSQVDARRAELDRIARENAKQIAEARRRAYLKQIEEAQRQATLRSQQEAARARLESATNIYGTSDKKLGQLDSITGYYGEKPQEANRGQRGGYPGVPNWSFRGGYPGLKNVQTPFNIGLSNLIQEALQVDEQYYNDAWRYGGPRGQLPGIPQAQPPVSYLPTMNTLDAITKPSGYGPTPPKKDYDRSALDHPMDMSFQWDLEQYHDLDYPRGSVGVNEELTPTQYYDDYGGYTYPNYGGYEYPEYEKTPYSSKPTVNTGVGRNPRSWYEKMLKWNI